MRAPPPLTISFYSFCARRRGSPWRALFCWPRSRARGRRVRAVSVRLRPAWGVRAADPVAACHCAAAACRSGHRCAAALHPAPGAADNRPAAAYRYAAAACLRAAAAVYPCGCPAVWCAAGSRPAAACLRRLPSAGAFPGSSAAQALLPRLPFLLS